MLKAGPQDLPASNALLAGALGAYMLIGVVLSLPGYNFGASLLQAMIDTVLLIGIAYAVLSLGKHSERYVQTLTALAGSGAIFGLAALPLFYFLNDSLAAGMAGDGAGSSWLIVYLAMLIWVLTVYGHIFRHALSSSLAFGLLISLGYAVVTSAVIQALFPPPQLG